MSFGGIDLKLRHDTERQLMHVACTRTRDRLLVIDVDSVFGKFGKFLTLDQE